MALTAYKIVQATSATALVALVAAEIADGNSPVGAPMLTLAQNYPEKFNISQAIAVGVDTVTDYDLVQAKKAADLAEAVTDLIGDGAKLLGGLIAMPSTQNPSKTAYYQAVYKGTPADAGMAAGGGAGGPIAISDVTGLQAALDGKAATAHNHAGADITSGTIAAARLPDATEAAKGVVQVGSGLNVAAGVISVAA